MEWYAMTILAMYVIFFIVAVSILLFHHDTDRENKKRDNAKKAIRRSEEWSQQKHKKQIEIVKLVCENRALKAQIKIQNDPTDVKENRLLIAKNKLRFLREHTDFNYGWAELNKTEIDELLFLLGDAWWEGKYEGADNQCKSNEDTMTTN